MNLSDKPAALGIDPMALLHCRTGCCSCGKLTEGHRLRLFTGSGLSREHLSKAAGRKNQKILCKFCAQAKITRSSFTESQDHKEYTFSEYISADISVYLNCPSRLGYRYVLLFTCKGTKYIFPYGLKTRTEPDILSCIKDLCENVLPRFGQHRWKHYHADGAGELIGSSIKKYLTLRFGTHMTWSSTDTPELNSVSERKFRTLGEMTLAMLLRSGLSKHFWFDAYLAACHITLRLPTRTYKGWMSPFECCPGGSVPSLGRLRVWGCKAYVLTPKADRRKDWEEKAQTGVFIAYSDSKQGWTVWLPEYDKSVTSVHVLFDEQPPSRPEEYYKEIDSAKVIVDPEEKSISEFLYLINTYHVDEGFLYKTTRVIVRKGLIVGYRALITADKEMLEEQVSIHIADIKQMTAAYNDSSMTVGRDIGIIGQGLPREGIGQILPDHPRPAANGEQRAGVSAGTALHLNIVNEGQQADGSATAGPANIGVAREVERNARSTGTKGPPVTAAAARVVNNGASVEDKLPTTAKFRGAEHRRRVQRVLTNVGQLGQMNSIEQMSMFQALAEVNMMEVNAHPEQILYEPQGYKDSLASPQSQQWSDARMKEKASLHKRKVMALHRIPEGAKILKSRYIYKIKRDSQGKVKEFKARLVVLGCQQEKGVDVEQTFAPVVKGVTIRLIMALAFILNMLIHQIDISSAFCYANIEEDVYMKPPPEMKVEPGWCFKLFKSLYGLRASPRNWNRHLDKYIKSLHFTPSVLDPCLYYRWHDGKLALILVYVDDILIAHKDLSFICSIKDSFLSTFDMTDMGEMEHFLNIKITRTTNTLRMDQTTYAKKILAKFADYIGTSKKGKKYPFPADAQERLADTTPETAAQRLFASCFPYRSIVGALLYLSTYTRPDLAYPVGVLARFGNDPTYAACMLAIHVLIYLRGTVDQGIQFSGSEFDMHVFSDADWAGDIMTRRSTTGYVVFAGGGPIAWQSRLQTTVATSSMESEYMALYAGMQELVWLWGVMKELQLPLLEPTSFFLDSQSAEDLAMNPVFHKRSKHIAIKYHWVRQHVVGGIFGTARLVHVNTHEMSADIFTKALTGPAFVTHRDTTSGTKRSMSSVVESRQPKKGRKR